MIIIELQTVLRNAMAAYMIAGFIEQIAFLSHLRMIIFVQQLNFIKDARAGRPCASVLRKLSFCLLQIQKKNLIIIN